MMMKKAEYDFLQEAAKQRITIYDGTTWDFYDHGKIQNHHHNADKKKQSLPPLVCIPGTSGTPLCFHQQMKELATKGYRVLAIQHPVVWTHEEWIHSFDRFLDALHIEKAHIYGVSLGAYLAQRYCAMYPNRVISLAMTRGFCDTTVYRANSPSRWINTLAYMPEFYLKKYILEKFPRRPQRSPVLVEAIDYMVDQLETLTQQQIASRLTLNCLPCDPNSWKLKLPDEKITFIDSYAETSLPSKLKDQMKHRYPGAKQAHIKGAGDFPFLSHHEEVTMHLQVHLRTNGLFISQEN